MNDNKRNKSEKLSYIFTRETMGMTLLLFCAIVFIMLLTGSSVFAGIGRAVCTFMYGTFGYGSWLLIGALAYLGEWLVFEKKIKLSVKKILVIALTAFVLFLLFHQVSSRSIPLNGYGAYIGNCYKNAQSGWAGYTFGGVISAIFVYPLAKLSPAASYVILSILAVGCGYLDYLVFRPSALSKRKTAETGETEQITVHEAQTVEEVADGEYEQSEQPAPVAPIMEQQTDTVEEDDKFSQKNLGRKILFEKGEFAAESYRRNMIFSEKSYFNNPASTVASEADYLSSFSSGNSKPATESAKTYSESYQEEVFNQPAAVAPTNYVYGEKPVDEINNYEQAGGGVYPVTDNSQYSSSFNEVADSDVYAPEDNTTQGQQFAESESTRPEPEQPRYEQIIREEPVEEKKDDKPDLYSIFGAEQRNERRIEPTLRTERAESSNAELFDNDDDDSDDAPDVFGKSVRPETPADTRRNSAESGLGSIRRVERAEKPVERAVERAAEKPAEKPDEEKPKHVWKKYIRPPLDLLDDYPENSNVNTGEIEDNKRIIVETLERFKIASEVANVTIGPAITRYDVIIADKTKINQSLKYRDAIAMELKKDNVTAYLNYTKGALSIEVPNNRRTIVGLKGMLASPKFINSKQGALAFALGKNVDGEVVCPDITKMPHLLVAGTTGSGKSICLSALLISLLYKYGPEELRLILVDPKQVEFISYDKLPHLMINEILYEVDKAIKALNWAIKEMERRYTLFKDMTESGIATKNLDEYNAHLPAGEEKLPKIVIVLDEFGDLMLQAKKDIESRIIKLVQKARACGIHLILATQRPSVDCITGLIKSNLPTRIGFKVNSFDDARTIFDIGGAEKLLGKGDMYFRSAENPDLTRIQGCFVDTHEVQKVTDFIKANNETYFDQSVSDFINTVEQEETQNSMGSGDGDEVAETKIDDTFIKALKYCVTSNQASVSMIQRRFPVGYIKACKIIDWMENMNYITQSEGSKPRKVLLSKEEFLNTYGDIDD